MFEFKDFKWFIEMRGEYANIPSSLLPSFKLFCGAILSIVIHFVGEAFYDVDIG